MPKGTVYPSERKTFEDPVSGADITQLTDYKAHSHHVYFTNPAWYADGKKILFGSDRENRTNLFGVEIESGEITQLTDTDARSFQILCCNNTRDEAYFWLDGKLTALDLDTLEERELWKLPDGFRTSMINCTADGKYICGCIQEDLSDRIRYGINYLGFPETFEAKPLCRIFKCAVDGSGSETVHEEKIWIGHVNTSPTQPSILSFCHEGPWDRVDNRIWGLNIETGEAWMIRPRKSDERVGHEYWHADGVYLGYHGHNSDGSKFFGKVKYDNTDPFEVSFPFTTGHIHSNGFDMIVGDGGKEVRLWKWNGESFDGPKCLAEHRCSFYMQKVHVHPRFNAEGTQVLFTTDMSGYGNVYLADVPDFGVLPEIRE